MPKDNRYGWLYADLSKSASIRAELKSYPGAFESLLKQIFDLLEKICKRYEGEPFPTAGDSITFIFPGKPLNAFRAAREILPTLVWTEPELDLPKLPAHKIQMKLICHVTTEEKKPEPERYDQAMLFFSRVDDKAADFAVPGRAVISEDLWIAIVKENPRLKAFFETRGMVRGKELGIEKGTLLYLYVEEPARDYIINQTHRKVVIEQDRTMIITHYDITILRNTTKIPVEPAPKMVSPLRQNDNIVKFGEMVELNRKDILCSLGVPMVYGKEIFVETYHVMPRGKNLSFAVGYILQGLYYENPDEEVFAITGRMIEGDVVLEIYLREDRRLINKDSVDVYGETRFPDDGQDSVRISHEDCSYEFCDADEDIHPNRQVIRFKFKASKIYSRYIILWRWREV